jgi:predicted membrane chloride channel (bestrophin family)
LTDVKQGERYSSQDWLTNVLSLPRSLTLRRISSHLIANLLLTAIVLLLRFKGTRIALSALPHQLMGSFLGLLLVFRTNAAYARFWEARHLVRVSVRVRKTTLTLTLTPNPYPYSTRRATCGAA